MPKVLVFLTLIVVLEALIFSGCATSGKKKADTDAFKTDVSTWK